MSFFKSLLETGLKRVVLDVIKTDSAVTVVVSPKSQVENTEPIKPLRISFPTVEELDAEFLKAMSSPLSKTSEYFSNIEEYEKQLEEMKNKKAEEAAKKAETKTSTKGKAAAKKSEPEKVEENKEEPAPDLFSISEDVTQEETEAIISEAKEIIKNSEPEKPQEETKPEPQTVTEFLTGEKPAPEPVKEEPTIEEAVVIEESPSFDPGDDDDDFFSPSLFD